MILNTGDGRLRTMVRKLLLGAAPAAGFALALVTAAPADAQLFFDIFNPPQQPQYSGAEQSRSYEARRAYRRHHREVRHKRRRHEVRRDTWNPKEVKGPFQIVVAIGPQEALLYGRDGLIATAKISTGRPDHPTPRGVFTVISKSRWHRSNIYSGAPMPWMQRITWSGIALHAGPRPGYPASHGCIRLPEGFAIRLYRTTKVGARVIVTRDAVAPVAIASAKLFVPAPAEEAAKTEANPVAVADAQDASSHMSFAAKSSGAKSSGTKASGKTTATDDADAKPADDAAKPTVTGAIALPPDLPAPAATDAPKPTGPVSVFVSRKQGKVFVRQGFVELFDMPATIADPDRAIGTHVYTAMATTDDGKGMRWTAMTVPSSYRHHTSRRHHHRKDKEAAEATLAPSSAAEALGRVTLPPQAVKRISELLIPGSSLIVSDNALSDETDDSTNFIVLTR